MEIKVMLIDDEKIVREGICEMILQGAEEEQIRLTPCGKDGRSGLELILSERPDIVLVDIKMPGMSGLEVIKEARARGFEGHLIILTGYSEFEYARSAIALGVEGYLLKPIDEEELWSYLRRIREDIEKAAKLQERHDQVTDKLRWDLLRRIVLNAAPLEELIQDMERYQMDLTADCFCVAVCRELTPEPVAGGESLYSRTCSLLEGDISCMGVFLMDRQTVLVFRSVESALLKSRLEKRDKRLQAACGSMLLIAIGNNVRNWQDLSCSDESAVFLLDHSFLFGQENVLTIEQLCGMEKNGEMISLEHLETLIEVGELEGIRQALRIFHDHCIWHLLKEDEIKLKLIQDALQLHIRLGKKYPSVSGIDIQSGLERLLGVKELKTLLVRYEQLLIAFSQKIGSEGIGSVIRRVYYCMEKNYDKDLKLEGIAKLFNYNSAYLGKRFQKEMGESFNNSLDIIRIANAKRLLEETDLKVYQISEQVGYSSIDYFYVKFKKYVGISPRDYRRLKGPSE